jgi:hypothetical protein
VPAKASRRSKKEISEEIFTLLETKDVSITDLQKHLRMSNRAVTEYLTFLQHIQSKPQIHIEKVERFWKLSIKKKSHVEKDRKWGS